MAVRVLLVDDDSRIADTARDILESLGCEMDWAKSQKEAEQFVGNKQYDCILLDREIPVRENRIADVEHGDILFDRFMHDPHLTDVPVIIVTGHDVDGPDRAVEMVKAGAFDYVTKPFKKKGKTLASVITRALEKRERQGPGGRIPPCSLTVSGLAGLGQKPAPDGPRPPDEFWWKGKRLTLPRLEWRLLNFMWPRDRATEGELSEHVWKEKWEKADRPSPNNISTTLSRLNKTLQELKTTSPLPFVRLEYKGGYVRKVKRKAK